MSSFPTQEKNVLSSRQSQVNTELFMHRFCDLMKLMQNVTWNKISNNFIDMNPFFGGNDNDAEIIQSSPRVCHRSIQVNKMNTEY